MVGEPVEVLCERLPVGQRHQVLHDQILLGRRGVAHPTGSHASRSVMRLCGSLLKRGRTFIPVLMASIDPASTGLTMDVSLPSGWTNAKEKGWPRGCFGLG